MLATRHFNCLLAVTGFHHATVSHFQHRSEHLARIVVIFNYQHVGFSSSPLPM
jgi:hypothetical protein